MLTFAWTFACIFLWLFSIYWYFFWGGLHERPIEKFSGVMAPCVLMIFGSLLGSHWPSYLGGVGVILSLLYLAFVAVKEGLDAIVRKSNGSDVGD